MAKPSAKPSGDLSERLNVGGQAVIEGVMMRSPRSFAVVCRRPNGEIVIKEDAWEPVWASLKFLRWPFLRGAIMMFESLWNGMSALSFAADQQEVANGSPPPRSLGAAAAQPAAMSKLAKFGMLAVSIAFGLALFVGVPHLLSWGLGNLLGFDVQSFWFHAIDGVFKMTILIGYLAAISLLPDIRRVFQYHGAEHKSIYTYERGLPLTIDNARAQTRFHPRCGTSFLLLVIIVSVVLFSATLRFQLAESVAFDHLLKIVLKIPLMFPIAGLAYEFIKISGKHYQHSTLARAVAAPGLWLQNITTKEPTDDQLEIALISIRKAIWRERSLNELEQRPGGIEVFASAADVNLPLA